MNLRLLLIAVGLVIAVGCGGGDGGAHRTRSGDLVYQLEGLLHREFGSDAPCGAGDGHSLDFSHNGDQCAPLSTYTGYSYVFADHTDSTLRQAKTVPSSRDQFGNGAVVVRVGGNAIACATDDSHFLVAEMRTLNLALDCLEPL